MLEDSHLVARITSLLGSYVNIGTDWASKHLPDGANDAIQDVVSKALRAALDTALLGVDHTGAGLIGWSWMDEQISSKWFDSVSAAISGAGGGAAGLAGTLVELPITTTILMRAIAQIARSEGEDLTSEESKLECLHVFAFGGPSSSDDGAESGYYAVRLALAQALNQAAGKALQDILPNTVMLVAARFGVPATWKVAAQAVPIAGAVMGALINIAFVDHFHDKARGHFIVRRLERAHGENQVQSCYEKVRAERIAALNKPRRSKARSNAK